MLFGWEMIVCTVDCPQIIDEKLLLDFVKGCDLWCPLNGLPLTILYAWVMTRAFECKLWTLLLLYLNSGATKEPKKSWSHVGKKIELYEAWKNIWDFELHWSNCLCCTFEENVFVFIVLPHLLLETILPNADAKRFKFQQHYRFSMNVQVSLVISSTYTRLCLNENLY